MKYLILIIASAALLSGCASFEEAYQLDREYGMASQAALDKQIVYTDYRYAEKTPENTEGIVAEEIMDVYINTFAEEPEQVQVFRMGIQQ